MDVIDDPALCALFRAESFQRLSRLDDSLARLASAPLDGSCLAEVFRQAHSLKGAAHMLCLDAIQAEAHAMEETLLGVRASMWMDTLRAHRSRLEQLIRQVLAAAAERASACPHRSRCDPQAREESCAAIAAGAGAGAEARAAADGWRPLGEMFAFFPPMVEALAQREGKAVAMGMEGGDIRVPRDVLDALKDPLMHLLGNAVHQGLETREERVAVRKPVQGRIDVRAIEADVWLAIEVRDDGRGLDSASIRDAAVGAGIIDGDAATRLTRREIDALVFEAGLSTVCVADAAAGRGIGLDIVRSGARSLGGTVEVSSLAGCGTRFAIRLPRRVR